MICENVMVVFVLNLENFYDIRISIVFFPSFLYNTTFFIIQVSLRLILFICKSQFLFQAYNLQLIVEVFLYTQRNWNVTKFTESFSALPLFCF